MIGSASTDTDNGLLTAEHRRNCAFLLPSEQPGNTHTVKHQSSTGKRGNAVPTASGETVILKSLNVHIFQLRDLRLLIRLPEHSKIVLDSSSEHHLFVDSDL